jgi:hypothetical protein
VAITVAAPCFRPSGSADPAPEVGLLELDCQVLVDEERTQILALFSPAAERLTLLGSLGPLAAQRPSQ